MPETHQAFASAPKGMEPLLAVEIRELGGQSVRETKAGVGFESDLETLYRICLWSRLANRIMLQLANQRVENASDLYLLAGKIDWAQHLLPEGTLAVDFSGRLDDINHTHYGALRVKDAIVDQMRDRYNVRPSIDTAEPDIRVNVHVHREQAAISLDLSGDSLHRRGYRARGGKAPLKENLAAAILIRSGWPAICAEGGAFVDPMCGSGTLVIEAAMIAADMAPGLNRDYFGFQGWLGHESALWKKLLIEAEERLEIGLKRTPTMCGFDADRRIVRTAQENAARIGLANLVNFRACELAKLEPFEPTIKPGLLAVNPPYGERLGDTETLFHLYGFMGKCFLENFRGWKAAVITSGIELGKALGIRAHKKNVLYNGAMECLLLQFELDPSQAMSNRSHATGAGKKVDPELANSEGARMFANRLRKNLRTIGRWATQQNISCYRLYDADIPEYAVALDVYQDWVHLQEYAPPRSVDADQASQRLKEVVAVIPEVLGHDPRRIVLKQRERQKGSAQYNRMASEESFEVIEEQGVKLLVNFHDYLDTGVFLDHRITRSLIRDFAKGKNFLNLFAYTGTATVYAAQGGAKHCTTLDMSATYLDWAKKNLALNGLSEEQHQFLQEDCVEWLRQESKQYGLIFLDPPTFSNSKRMRNSFDVQRDHLSLISLAFNRLTTDGVLLFSCNRRHFKLATEQLLEAQPEMLVEDITAATLPKDFQKKPPAHYCWKISRK